MFEVLTAIVVLAFLIERALWIVFSHRWHVALEKRGFEGGKEIIAFLVSWAVCLRVAKSSGVAYGLPRRLHSTL